MNILGYEFKPKIWALCVSLIFVVVFIQLGNWQLSRADEKDARQHQLDQFAKQPVVSLPSSLIELEDFLYPKVEVRGEYLAAQTIYLDNRMHKGHAGYHIITPVKLYDSSMHVLINRGWVATGLDRTVLPDIPVIDGEVLVNGIVVPPTERALELSSQISTGAVWGTLYLDRYQEMTGLTLQPILIQQQDDVEDGLIREWSRPDSGSSKNLGYAFQWYSFAVLTVIILLVLNVKRNCKTQS
jgi:surfeit locus 1 family protein